MEKSNFEYTSAMSSKSNNNDTSTPLTQHSSLDSTRSLDSAIHDENSNRGMDLDDILEFEEAELNRIKRKQTMEEKEEEKEEEDILEEEVVTAHAGHLWKEAQSGRMFGFAAKHWQKRYFKLCRGRLSWFETKSSVRSRNSLLLDGYTLRKVGQVSNGQIQFELIHADASRRVLKLRAVSKLNFENWTNALESHIEFFDKSPLNFRYEFAGLKFLGTCGVGVRVFVTIECLIYPLNTTRIFEQNSNTKQVHIENNPCRREFVYPQKVISLWNRWVKSLWTLPFLPICSTSSLLHFEAVHSFDFVR